MTAAAPRVVRHSSELGSWEMWHADPDSRLRPQVRRYLGYEEETVGFTRRREVATGDVVLIVGFGPPIEIAFPALSSSMRLASFVSGTSDSYVLIDSFGSQSGVQVDLTPLGAYTLLGLPLRELSNTAIALEDVLGPEGALLPERLHTAPGWPERFAIVNELLRRRFAEGRPASPDVAWAWRRLVESEGRVRVETLTEELRCSRRHLANRFNEQVGLPPKTVARLLRFGRAMRLLDGAPGTRRMSLAEVAADCGYYDQAHLNRDFRELAGATPTEIEASLLPAEGGIRAG